STKTADNDEMRSPSQAHDGPKPATTRMVQSRQAAPAHPAQAQKPALKTCHMKAYTTRLLG
ncbi:MAG: hypothetical protein ACM3ZC_12770, partial [Bacteroidota bacterium]